MIRTSLVSVDVRPVRWPLRRPFVTALGRKTHSDNVLVTARLAGGARGWGEASSSLAMPWQTGPRMAAALRRLARRFRGRDARDAGKIAREARRAEEEMPTAAAAFEAALWDALACAEGIPFYKLWGGAAREIETLMSLSVGAPAEMAARAREGRRRGFRRLKLKLDGREGAGPNATRVAAVHRAHPRARLLLDPNQSFAPGPLAELLSSVRRAGWPVDAVEEPFKKKDWRTLRSFRGSSPLPVILDESVQDAADARRMVAGDLAQGANVKLAKSGLAEGKAVVELLEKSRRSLMIGCMAESKVGLAAAAQFAMGTGAFAWADLDSDLLLKPLPISGGYMRKGPWLVLPRNPPPGLGVSA